MIEPIRDHWVIVLGKDEADWQREVIEARSAPHMYLGPAWFGRDPAGWRSFGWSPYGAPEP